MDPFDEVNEINVNVSPYNDVSENHRRRRRHRNHNRHQEPQEYFENEFGEFEEVPRRQRHYSNRSRARTNFVRATHDPFSLFTMHHMVDPFAEMHRHMMQMDRMMARIFGEF